MPGIRFHLSLNVSELGRAVAFYRVLFGQEPAKLRADYAKFELAEPPLVFSLEPGAVGAGRPGALSHVGFRVSDAAALVAMQERLASAGLPTEREEGVECCYARQTKFWAHDPDGTLWEIYTLDEDLEHRGAGQVAEKVRPKETSAVIPASAPALRVWEHRLGEPLQAALADGSVDEARLRGSFNRALSQEEEAQLLQEALRVLRPGGRLQVHVLTADGSLTEPPGLTGQAQVVQQVPVTGELVALVTRAGFEATRLLRLDARPCFVRQGIGLRQTLLEAWKPAPLEGRCAVLYLGPFGEVRDDQGRVYLRGRAVPVDAAMAARLRAPEWAQTFLVLDAVPETAPDCGAR